MTDPQQLARTIRAKLEQFVPKGFRDEDGVWHDGPHRAEAHAALDALVGCLPPEPEPCPKGDECALNKGARTCRHCGRNWPPDETWGGGRAAGAAESGLQEAALSEPEGSAVGPAVAFTDASGQPRSGSGAESRPSASPSGSLSAALPGIVGQGAAPQRFGCPRPDDKSPRGLPGSISTARVESGEASRQPEQADSGGGRAADVVSDDALRQLREALITYGQHEWDCGRLKGNFSAPIPACTCGWLALRAALVAASSPARATTTAAERPSPESASDSSELVSLRARVAELEARVAASESEAEDARMEGIADAIIAAFPDADPDGYDASDLIRRNVEQVGNLRDELGARVATLEAALRDAARVFDWMTYAPTGTWYECFEQTVRAAKRSRAAARAALVLVEEPRP